MNKIPHIHNQDMLCGYCAEPVRPDDMYCCCCGAHITAKPVRAFYSPISHGNVRSGLICSNCGEFGIGRTRSHVVPHYCDACGVTLEITEEKFDSKRFRRKLSDN